MPNEFEQIQGLASTFGPNVKTPYDNYYEWRELPANATPDLTQTTGEISQWFDPEQEWRPVAFSVGIPYNDNLELHFVYKSEHPPVVDVISWNNSRHHLDLPNTLQPDYPRRLSIPPTEQYSKKSWVNRALLLQPVELTLFPNKASELETRFSTITAVVKPFLLQDRDSYRVIAEDPHRLRVNLVLKDNLDTSSMQDRLDDLELGFAEARDEIEKLQLAISELNYEKAKYLAAIARKESTAKSVHYPDFGR
jgi:hypothetical protein